MTHLPTAHLKTLQRRAILLATIRRFFDEAGYFEVETPILSSDIVVDAWLEPFVTHFYSPQNWTHEGQRVYLQTSPEFSMKRLLAAGATSIYQMGKVFRNGEQGLQDNPEFTMLEWYRVGDDHFRQMEFTERIVRKVFEVARAFWEADCRSLPDRFERVADERGFERLTYDAAFERYAGEPVLVASNSDLARLAERHHLVPPPGLELEDRDGWLNWLLAELVEPQLGRDRPTFLYHYPASQAALSRTVQTDPRSPAVAERFELYLDGVELCNGYHELTDAAALRARIQEQLELRAKAGLRPLPADSRLLKAMEAGLPDCSGNALGVDRLVMLALGAGSLDEVIAFPFDRA